MLVRIKNMIKIQTSFMLGWIHKGKNKMSYRFPIENKLVKNDQPQKILYRRFDARFFS